MIAGIVNKLSTGNFMFFNHNSVSSKLTKLEEDIENMSDTKDIFLYEL